MERLTQYRDYNSIPKFWSVGTMLGDEKSGVTLTFQEGAVQSSNDGYSPLESIQKGLEAFFNETSLSCPN